MKRSPVPFWFTLAVAASPLVHAENAATPAPAPAPAAKAVQASEADPLSGLQQHFESINKTIREARAEVADMAGQRDSAKKEAVAIRQAKEQLEQQLNGLKQQLNASNQEIGQWKDKANVLEKKLSAGEEAYAKLASFRDEMTATLKEFASLKGGLAEVRGELQAPAERVALKKDLDQLKAAHAELSKTSEQDKKALAATRQQLSASENALQGLKQSLAKVTEEAKAKIAGMAKLHQEREALSAKLAVNEKELTASRAETEKLWSSAAKLEKERDTAVDELAATRDTLASLQKESAQLRTTLEPLSKEIQNARQQTEIATAAIREANIGRKNAETAHANLQKEFDQLKGQLAGAVANRDQLQQQITAKSTEIESLRKTVEELNARTAQK